MTFEEWARRGSEPLLRAAFLLSGDRDLAEDLVQTVLARAHEMWSRIGCMDNVDGYVYRMLVNEHLSYRRRLREFPFGVLPRRQYGEAEPADASDASDAHDEMWRLLATCSRLQRTVLVLRYYEGLSDSEISEVLAIGEATVRSHIHRGLKVLRTALVSPVGVEVNP